MNPGRLDFFARGTDARLWQKYWINGTWSGWFKPVGDDGVLGSAPTALAMTGGIYTNYTEVFVTGTDGNIYERWNFGSGWNASWYPLASPPGGAVDKPAAVSVDGSRIDLFVRGADNRLWSKTFIPCTTTPCGWSAWFLPPGTETGVLASAPAAASRGPNHLAVSVRGTDNGLYFTQYLGGPTWQPWTGLGGPIQSAPGMAARSSQSIDVFGRGSDNLVYHWFYG